MENWSLQSILLTIDDNFQIFDNSRAERIEKYYYYFIRKLHSNLFNWLIDRVMKQQLIGRGEGNDTIAQRNGDYKSATNFSRI